MNLRHVASLGIGLACLALTACASYKPSPYFSTPANAAEAKAAVPAGAQVNLPAATSGAEVKKDKSGSEAIMCRGAGPIAPANNQSYEAYIHDALVTELKQAGVYSDQAGKAVQLKLVKIDFSSGLTDAEWDMIADVTVANDPPFTVTEKYPFSSSFAGGIACDDTANAFMPAVQDLVKKILANDQLKASLAKP